MINSFTYLIIEQKCECKWIMFWGRWKKNLGKWLEGIFKMLTIVSKYVTLCGKLNINELRIRCYG